MASAKVVGMVLNEIENYINGRFMSATEAMWRLFHFPTNDMSHSVFPLKVHEEKENWVTVHGDDTKGALEKAKKGQTHLTAYFKLNKEDPVARKFKYAEIPEHYVWDDRLMKWRPRKSCLLYTSPSPRDKRQSRMPSSA